MLQSGATLTPTKTVFAVGESVSFTYNGPRITIMGWIGLFPANSSTPTSNGLITWERVPHIPSGSLTISKFVQFGVYKAYLFVDNGYNIAAGPKTIEVASVFFYFFPLLTATKNKNTNPLRIFWLTQNVFEQKKIDFPFVEETFGNRLANQLQME